MRRYKTRIASVIRGPFSLGGRLRMIYLEIKASSRGRGSCPMRAFLILLKGERHFHADTASALICDIINPSPRFTLSPRVV